MVSVESGALMVNFVMVCISVSVMEFTVSMASIAPSSVEPVMVNVLLSSLMAQGMRLSHFLYLLVLSVLDIVR